MRSRFPLVRSIPLLYSFLLSLAIQNYNSYNTNHILYILFLIPLLLTVPFYKGIVFCIWFIIMYTDAISVSDTYLSILIFSYFKIITLITRKYCYRRHNRS